MCTLKGTTDGNWGDICVLAVSDLYQLPPVAHCPIYMSLQNCTHSMILLLIDGKKCSYMN